MVLLARLFLPFLPQNSHWEGWEENTEIHHLLLNLYWRNWEGFECGSITYNFRIERIMNECVFALFPHPQTGSNWSSLSKFYCKFHSNELCEMRSDPSDPFRRKRMDKFNGHIVNGQDVNGQEMVVLFISPLSSSQPRTFILCNWNWIVCFAMEMDGVNCSFRWVFSLVWDCHHLRTFGLLNPWLIQFNLLHW